MARTLAVVIVALAVAVGISFHPPTVYKLGQVLREYHPAWRALHVASLSNGVTKQNVVTAAVSLGVIDALHHSPLTVNSLSSQLGVPKRTMRVLCEALLAVDLVAADGDGVLRLLGPAEHHLVTGKEDSLDWMFRLTGGRFASILSAHPLAEVVRNGGGMLGKEGAEKPNHEFWEIFAQVTGPGMVQAAAAAAGFAREANPNAKSILDIASGSGAYGFALARAFPEAKTVLFDYPNVLAETAKNVPADLKAAFGKTLTTSPGDFFKGPLPGAPYDIIAVPNFYHHFGDSVCQEITNKVFASLKPGGTVVIVEFVRPEGLTGLSNDQATFFGVMMMSWSQQGDAYRASDYKRWADKAGFKGFQHKTHFPLPMGFLILQK